MRETTSGIHFFKGAHHSGQRVGATTAATRVEFTTLSGCVLWKLTVDTTGTNIFIAQGLMDNYFFLWYWVVGDGCDGWCTFAYIKLNDNLTFTVINKIFSFQLRSSFSVRNLRSAAIMKSSFAQRVRTCLNMIEHVLWISSNCDILLHIELECGIASSRYFLCNFYRGG